MPQCGTAANYHQKAMIAAVAGFAMPDDVHMIMQVHDELVFEITRVLLEGTNITVHKLMESSMNYSLKVEAN